MQRLFSALLLAISIHFLFFFLPAQHETKELPKISGEETTIRIKLSTVVSPVQKQEPHSSKKEPIEKNIPAKTITENKVETIPVAITAKRSKKILKQTPNNSPKTVKATNPKPIPISTQKKTAQAKTPQAIIKAKPLYHKNPKPEYPNIAKRRNWEGTSVLLVSVSKSGEVKQVRIHTGSGHKILDKSAIKSVKLWHFVPGTENGKPVEMNVLVPIHFKLH